MDSIIKAGRAYGACNEMDFFCYKQCAPREHKTTSIENYYLIIQQRIAHSEDKINQFVYELYELTTEEIAIVDNSNNN